MLCSSVASQLFLALVSLEPPTESTGDCWLLFKIIFFFFVNLFFFCSLPSQPCDRQEQEARFLSSVAHTPTFECEQEFSVALCCVDTNKPRNLFSWLSCNIVHSQSLFSQPEVILHLLVVLSLLKGLNFDFLAPFEQGRTRTERNKLLARGPGFI